MDPNNAVEIGRDVYRFVNDHPWVAPLVRPVVEWAVRRTGAYGLSKYRSLRARRDEEVPAEAATADTTTPSSEASQNDEGTQGGNPARSDPDTQNEPR